jgi:hypothetical protein
MSEEVGGGALPVNANDGPVTDIGEIDPNTLEGDTKVSFEDPNLLDLSFNINITLMTIFNNILKYLIINIFDF